jgi:CheY-like chemotaxis protein
VDSSPGLGSTFKVLLPGVSYSDNEQDMYISKVEDEIEYRFKPAKVLVVDDVKNNREVLSEILKLVGLQPITASNGFEAIEKFEGEKPDLILMDIRMAEMDGIQTAQKIRNIEKGNTVPIIAVTASIKGETSIDYSKFFDRLLYKPVESVKVYKVLSEFLENVKKVRDADNTQSWKASLEKDMNEKVAGCFELIGKISIEVKPLLETLDCGISIDDVSNLSAVIERLGIEFKSKFLVNLASQLSVATNSLDISGIETCISLFKSWLDKLKKQGNN